MPRKTIRQLEAANAELESQFSRSLRNYAELEARYVSLRSNTGKVTAKATEIAERATELDIENHRLLELVTGCVVSRARDFDMPNPTEADLERPLFRAIWGAIKSWDVNVPEYYEGYCGANGSHVKLILNAIEKMQDEIDPGGARQ